MSTQTLRRELRINRELDTSMNELLAGMKKFMDDARIWESRMEEHGINNVVAVAQETGSVEVVKNYVRYQIGRDVSNANWRWRVGNVKNFGEQLVDKLDELHDLATGIVAGASNPGAPPRDVDRVWMRLTRSYLGHLSRYFVYRKKTLEERR
jgi:hypothetical protein